MRKNCLIYISIFILLSALPLAAQMAPFNSIVNGINGNRVTVLNIYDIVNCKNDLQKFGLKGSVRSMTENEDVYQFNSSGLLTSATHTILLMDINGGKDSKEVTQVNYMYNDKNQLTSCSTAKKGDKAQVVTFVYDKNGKLQSTDKCTYVYNEEGLITQLKQYKTDTYNDQGLLICTHISGNNDVIYSYNAYGQCLRRETEEEGMDEIDHEISLFTYNTQGDIIQRTCIMQYFNKLVKDNRMQAGAFQDQSKNVLTYTYQYDSQNNWISRKCSDGEIVKRTITYY